MIATDALTVTTTPATGSSVVVDGDKIRSVKAVRFVTLHGDEARRTFTSTDTDGKTSTYMLSQITEYADGTSWAWAAQMTKKGHPYRNGMGLTLGDRSEGRPVLEAVRAEALMLAAHADALEAHEAWTAARLDELAARGQAILDAKGQTVDEYWDSVRLLGAFTDLILVSADYEHRTVNRDTFNTVRASSVAALGPAFVEAAEQHLLRSGWDAAALNRIGTDRAAVQRLYDEIVGA